MDSAANALIDFLLNDSGVYATDVRDTLTDNTAVYDANMFDMSILDAQQENRRDGTYREGTLAITIMDAGGENYVNNSLVVTESVVVRVIDRGRHAANIEATRQALIDLFRSTRLYDVSIGGILDIVHVSRTGLLYDAKASADYEMYNLTVVRGG